MSFTVRRVQADEWSRVRDLRLDAVRDPAAPIAFLHTFDEESAHGDGFWQQRTEGASRGDAVAQFVAEDRDQWVGTVSVLRWAPGTTDYNDRPVATPRAGVVGVFVRPEHRGRGIIDALLNAAAEWTSALGDELLILDVHEDNERAQAAYRRNGFTDTGRRFTGVIGVEREMARALREGAEAQA